MHIMFGDRTLIRDLSRNDLIGKFILSKFSIRRNLKQTKLRLLAYHHYGGYHTCSFTTLRVDTAPQSRNLCDIWAPGHRLAFRVPP